jgi:hypothetical protein
VEFQTSITRPTFGLRGSRNLWHGMKVAEVQPVALCDMNEQHLERAQNTARKNIRIAQAGTAAKRDVAVTFLPN